MCEKAPPFSSPDGSRLKHHSHPLVREKHRQIQDKEHGDEKDQFATSGGVCRVAFGVLGLASRELSRRSHA